MTPMRLVTSDIALVFGMGAAFYLVAALHFPRSRHLSAICAVVCSVGLVAALEFLLTGRVT